MADAPGGSAGSPNDPTAHAPRAQWRTHAVLGVVLGLCALAFWVELGRAREGNALSWAYVVEWPLLGAFALYMWWRVVHPARRPPDPERPEIAPEFEGMLSAWRDHVRDLEASRAPSEDPPRTAGPEGR